MTDRRSAWLDAEPYLERFEAAWFRAGTADVREFLPATDHPLYRSILRELVCVALELGQGQPGHDAATYRARFPELADDPALADPACRAHVASVPALPPAEVATRVSGWCQRAEALYAEYRRQQHQETPGSLDHADWLLSLERDDPEAAKLFADMVPRPACGSDFLGFHLVRELGRGTFGQVFLAEQVGLANRPVALKVGSDLFAESQTLAQLQHSNIVPVYSAHRHGTLQAVCMPFFGATTLADVLRAMQKQGGVPTQGNALWSTLRDTNSQTPSTEPTLPEVTPHPTPRSLASLRTLSHVEAVVWIAARLADGLAHAHERGILHQDLKPANVLLADDGTPMLLDFNLAQNARLRNGIPAILGGTLPYMAPEHLEAFRDGSKTVDARSDIYALGLILFELLAGQAAFPVRVGKLREQMPHLLADRQAGPPSARRLNPAVPHAVDALVRRCLHPDPAQRYQQARELQEDAQRHLDDLPLWHTPDPSFVERAGKFWRRHPRLVWGGLAALCALVGATLLYLYTNLSRHTERVEARNTRLEHREELRDARILLGLPFPDATEWAEGAALCRRALGRYGLPDAAAWEQHLRGLPAEERAAVRAELGELLLLLARATWQSGHADAALRHNAAAEALVAPPERRSVLLQRALLCRLLGREADAQALLAEGRALPLQTARDRYVLAGEYASQGAVLEATRLLEEATALEPSNAAAWAAWGACASALGQQQAAVAAYTTCIALRPGFWRAYLWRAQAHLELHDPVRAEADCTAVLAARPGFAAALTVRALARLARKNLLGAEADATEALRASEHTRLYFIRARIRQQANDAAGADADRAEGLRREPADELSWIARGVARLPGDPTAALADFDKALALNPWSRSAAQNKAHVLAEHLHQPEAASAVLAPVVQRYPDYTEARIGRAVLLARLGRRTLALADAAEALRRDTRPLVQYQAGCVHALTARQEPADQAEAFRLLYRALRGGFGADLLARDDDLKSLRGHAEFRRLLDLAAPPK